MSCPVTKQSGVCPVDVKKVTIINEENQFESKDEYAEPEFEDLSNLTPGEKEYRQLSRTMATIKKFYLDGSKAKKDQYENASMQISLLSEDIKMAKEQMDAFSDKPTYKAHLKQKEYLELVKGDLDHLLKQLKERTEQEKDFRELYEWSCEINKICEWLDSYLIEYCIKNLDLTVKEFKEPSPLTFEEKLAYSKGLDEIMNNLNESHDFFQASTDGRLLEFQYMEAEIIQSQMDVLKKYPEDSRRREYFAEIFQKDLEYCQSRIISGVDPVEEKKREKVLKMHTEFLKLLRFFRYKWNLLNEEIVDKKYDPKFTQVYVYENAPEQ